MTPMIDVVFMLLIFFVWTTSFQVPELMLPSSIISELSGQGSQTEVDPDMLDLERVVVRIGWDGEPRWMVNDGPAETLQDVALRLRAVGSVKSDLPVLVDPVPAVPLGHVINVYDLARLAGFQNVQFATTAEGATP